MDKDDGLNDQPPLKVVAWEALLPAGESSLQSTHPPLAHLTKRRMHIADSQKVLPDVLIKTSGSPFGDGADERSICFSAPGKP